MAGLGEAFSTQLQNQLVNLGAGAVDGITATVIVLVFLAIGWLIAWAVARVVTELFKRVRVAETFKERGIPFEVAGFSVTSVVAFLLRVFIVLGFIGAGVAAAGERLGVLKGIIEGVVNYIPSLIQGAVLLIAALVFAKYLSDLIRRSEELPAAHVAAIIMQVFVAYVALVLALPLILPGVNVRILEQAFFWFLAASGIAVGIGFGLAIGLGLKDQVAKSAARHPGLFETFFGETERAVRKTVKRR
ncbi:hypothetical protein HY546_00605 [archaeon]|nr:hypothetical protein [archaeon]